MFSTWVFPHTFPGGSSASVDGSFDRVHVGGLTKLEGWLFLFWFWVIGCRISELRAREEVMHVIWNSLAMKNAVIGDLQCRDGCHSLDEIPQYNSSKEPGMHFFLGMIWPSSVVVFSTHQDSTPAASLRYRIIDDLHNEQKEPTWKTYVQIYNWTIDHFLVCTCNSTI